jgi:hypothetical protein
MTIEGPSPLITPYLLQWSDVDPARHPFDADEARAVVWSVASPVPPRPVRDGSRMVGEEEAHRWRRAVSHALVERYGRWACGWCWSRGEGDIDGGPVGGWCCGPHSISSEDETLARVADSLVEWRGWLEDLAEQFGRFLPLPDPDESSDDLVVAWEVAVGQLVIATVDRTLSESGWYNHCNQVLTWFLTAAGMPPQHHSTLVADAIGGRFHSWVEPPPTDISAVAERLAETVVGDLVVGQLTARPPRVDALATWQAVRAGVDWYSAAGHVNGPVSSGRDGIAEYVARRETGGDDLAAALDEVRVAAGGRDPLTFARLAEWQRLVLAVPEARFRIGPALAKGGRERYYWRPNLADQLDECLAEATDDDVPLPSRAARAYLDVLFFHPFDDGNARSAMLALYFVLAREGVVLDRAEPVLATARPAHDSLGAAGLARLIETLIDATRNRAPS